MQTTSRTQLPGETGAAGALVAGAGVAGWTGDCAGTWAGCAGTAPVAGGTARDLPGRVTGREEPAWWSCGCAGAATGSRVGLGRTWPSVTTRTTPGTPAGAGARLDTASPSANAPAVTASGGHARHSRRWRRLVGGWMTTRGPKPPLGWNRSGRRSGCQVSISDLIAAPQRKPRSGSPASGRELTRIPLETHGDLLLIGVGQRLPHDLQRRPQARGDGARRDVERPGDLVPRHARVEVEDHGRPELGAQRPQRPGHQRPRLDA